MIGMMVMMCGGDSCMCEDGCSGDPAELHPGVPPGELCVSGVGPVPDVEPPSHQMRLLLQCLHRVPRHPPVSQVLHHPPPPSLSYQHENPLIRPQSYICQELASFTHVPYSTGLAAAIADSSHSAVALCAAISP
jgi:hypothetical protein